LLPAFHAYESQLLRHLLLKSSGERHIAVKPDFMIPFHKNQGLLALFCGCIWRRPGSHSSQHFLHRPYASLMHLRRPPRPFLLDTLSTVGKHLCPSISTSANMHHWKPQSAASVSRQPNSFYGHEHIVFVPSFSLHSWNSSGLTVKLTCFITYALHSMKLHPLVAFAAFILLQ